MAHRNIKITRDIVQTCNKLHVFNKPDLCSLSSYKPAELSENAPKNITKNNFHPNSENKCSELIQKNTNAISPFPDSTKATIHNGTILGIKSLEMIANRSIVNTSLGVTASRSYSSSKKDGEKGCKPLDKKCIKNLPCPKFILPDCPQARAPPECKRQYIESQCTKKMAPYPSYSELCAYRMEDHPSECQQCPWQKCGGVEDIVPQKKKYHTSARVLNMAMIPSKSNDLTPLLLQKQCDASKEPCKEPPPKCKTREVKKEKCPEKKEKSKKKCGDKVLPREAYIISGSMKNLDIQRDGLIIMFGEHDKGHPPPCEEKKLPKDEYCPKEVDKKKIYRRERDLYDPTYRRYPNPMTDPEAK